VVLLGTGTNNLSSTASNVISGNRIRDNGRAASASGIWLQYGAYYNRIGGSAAADRNFIFNNVGDGIRIESSNSNGILGNTIGSQTSAQYNNTGSGIRIDAGEDNWIGGLAPVAAAGNDIGGNDQDGIALTNGTHKTTITRNLIGSDEYGVPRKNGASGISIQSGSYSTTIGTGNAVDRNVIAGNALHGIRIDGATTTSNTLRYNDIGLNTDPSLTGCPCTVAVPNGGFGLVLQNNAHHNRLEGANYIAYNGSGGVWVLTGAHDNLLGQDPVSGVANDEIFANTGSGILFSDAQWNLVRRASIYNNSHDGIEQNSSGSNNSWISTTTYLNGGLGIDIGTTANDNTPTAGYPVITSVVRAGGVVSVTGTSDTTFFNNFANYRTTTVYLLHGGLDPSGYGEGSILAGSASTNASGVWRVVYAEGATPLCYAAYKRVVASNGLAFSDAGSEFSLSTCTPKKAYVPMVVR